MTVKYYLEKLVAGAWVLDSTYTDAVSADAACAALTAGGATCRITTNASPMYTI